MLTFKPKAYEPEQGYMYQIFWRQYSREWESIDYARDLTDLRYLMNEYKMAQSGEYDCVYLPKEFHPVKPARTTNFKKLLHSSQYWDTCEVISQGHTSNLVLDIKVIGDSYKQGGVRVFNSRMRKEDGAEYDREISIEVYNTFDHIWQEVFKYESADITEGESLHTFTQKDDICEVCFAYEITDLHWFKRYFTGWRRIIGDLPRD